MVMVIDDIQWIDPSSIELLESLVTDKDMTGFMLIATCRDDEITDDHPFSRAMQNLREDKTVTVNDIQLGSLSIDAVCELVVDTFPTLAGRDLEALSGVLHTHTSGNAFFTAQILHRLKRSGWKAPPPPAECPAHRDSIVGGRKDEEWDSSNEQSMIDHLTKLECDKLIGIVVSDAANETPFMGEVLKAASCLGSDFVTSHLMMVVGNDVNNKNIFDALTLMETKGFIQSKYFSGGTHDAWSWTHDKFQKAAYLLIDCNERKLFHLKVGRRLLAELSKDELDQHLFIVVSQFCISINKIKDEDEREKVAALLLQAGEKSAQSSSFSKAASYVAMGMSLLKADNWEVQYELSLHLYSAAAEMECCKGDFVTANRLMNVILRHTNSIKDQLRAYEAKLYYLTVQDENRQVLCLALDVLDQLGEKLPRKPGMATILYEIVTTRWLLSKKSVDDVLNLQPLSDWKKIAIIRVIQTAIVAGIGASPELLPIMICRSIKLTIKYGLCAMSSSVFANMCLILYHPLRCIDEGNKCATVAERLMDEYGVEEFMLCRVKLTLAVGSLPFRIPIRGMLQPLESASATGFLTGDVEFAISAIVICAYTMFFAGERLDLVSSAVMDCKKKLAGIGRFSKHHSHTISVLLQMIENFKISKNTCNDDPCIFTGNFMDEERWLQIPEMEKDQYTRRYMWTLKVFIAFYLGQYEKAKGFMTTLKRNHIKSSGGASLFLIFFFDIMIDILLARGDDDEDKNKDSNGGTVCDDDNTGTTSSQGGNKKRKQKKRSSSSSSKKKVTNFDKSSLDKLRSYGKNVPANISNKISLIEAELAVVKWNSTTRKGNNRRKKGTATTTPPQRMSTTTTTTTTRMTQQQMMMICPVAKSKFELSIDQAHRNGYIHEEALANERYAVALFEWGETCQALEYFERARTLYEYWGAPVKVSQLLNLVKDKSGITMMKQMTTTTIEGQPGFYETATTTI